MAKIDELLPFKWYNYMPYLLSLVVVIDFVVIPSYSIGNTVTSIGDVYLSQLTGPLALIAFINGSILFYWLATIIRQAKAHLTAVNDEKRRREIGGVEHLTMEE